ncbi:MAG TPA: efflux RND transporter periplasmic adaptor subunit [Vicinamibacterales bacterium]|nr:efflux RND transporter periplasmic adaptor subunit [Vicinamibacterales bacterium]
MSITNAMAGTALAALLAAGGCAHEEPYQKPKTPVAVQPVGTTEGSDVLRYSAALLPARRVDLAFKIGGYVSELAQRSGAGGTRAIHEGDRVRTGDVLARIRQEDVLAKVHQAESQLAEADAAAAQARQAWDRARGLYDRKSLTRPDYDAAKAAFDTVQAKQAGARALVAEARNALADSTLRSPIDGVVIKRLVEVGSLVGPGTPGFVLADVTSVKALFGVPDALLARLPLRQAVTMTTEAFPGAHFPGRVTSVAPAADPGSLVFDVEVTAPNPEGRLKPGMVAAIELPAGEHTAVMTVPLAAVVRSTTRQDGYAVYVIETRDDGPHAAVREVALGPLVGNGVSVTNGLRASDRVIVSGATIVTNGEPVEILR